MEVTKYTSSLIGETPLVQLQRSIPYKAAQVFVKLETANPTGSIYDRVALNIVEVAENDGRLTSGQKLVIAATAEIAASFALLTASKGYDLVAFIPDTATQHDLTVLRAYGVKVNLVAGGQGVANAIKQARDLGQTSGHVFVDVYNDEANAAVHEHTTGLEIIEALGSAPDAFVTTVATGGTMTGVGRALRKDNQKVQLFAVEDKDAKFLGGEIAFPSKQTGFNAGILPLNLDTSLYDSIIDLDLAKAAEMTRLLAINEGLLVGLAGGASVAAAIAVAQTLGRNQKVVAVVPDDGRRFIAQGIFDFKQEL
ncbi:PLP-dependent cysteine synthase family protein [Aerococcus sp. 1KP-2016]|uniref:PLP-dependent cysteine synthase family protein n=1 Tax=Aerococcus sp. 1KP-2016 TaxID=1981982 RepID=UPI000B992303|nr:pyridoxal-phosphate dependent enzyme [Aerococcus sp. 1KP-2016]OYQ68070.1 cysteine synthase [Aerococcus sp. 1KP-2016]